MKNIRLFVFILSLVLIALGVCGCTSNDKNYNSTILKYLSNKYDTEFQITKSGMEFNGNDGNYFHAICTSSDYSDEFSVYCYPERESVREKVIINNIEHAIYDNYAEVVFSKQLEEQITNQIDKGLFLRCQVSFPNYYLTDEEYNAGLKACFEDSSILSNVAIYVISPNTSDIEDCQTKIEEICLQNNARWQYLYFATTNSKNFAEVSKHYKKEDGSFDLHLKECELIDELQFTLMKQDEGIIERTKEK